MEEIELGIDAYFFSNPSTTWFISGLHIQYYYTYVE